MTYGCAVVQFQAEAPTSIVVDAVKKAGKAGIKVMKFVIHVTLWKKLFGASTAAAPAPAVATAPAAAPVAARAAAPAAPAAVDEDLRLPGLPKHMQSAASAANARGDRGSELLNRAYAEVHKLRDFIPQQKREPKLSLDMCVVVTGLPIVPDNPDGGKAERLVALVKGKAFKGFPIARDGFYMPGGPEGTTMGVAVVEFTDVRAVQAAVKVSGSRGVALTERLRVHIGALRELIEAHDAPPAPELPACRPLALSPGLLQWFADPNQRDQALFRFSHREGDGLHVVSADSQHAPSVAYDGKDQAAASPDGCWTHRRAEWSPLGTFLVTHHEQGAKLWAGDRFKAALSLPHPHVESVQINHDETLAITFSPLIVPDREAGIGFVQPLTKVWDLRLGLCLQEWTSLNRGERPTQPDTFFVCDGQHIVRVAKTGYRLANGDERDSGLLGYVVNTAHGSVDILPNGILRMPSVFHVQPSPAGMPVVAVYSPEHEASQPSVSIVTVPLMHILREKKLVDTLAVSMHWHPQGRYLATSAISLTRQQASTRRKEHLREQAFAGTVLPPPEVSFCHRPKADRAEAMQRAITDGASNTVEVFRFDRPKLAQTVAAASSGAELDGGLVPVDVVTLKTYIHRLRWEPKGNRLAIVHGAPAEKPAVSFMSVGEEAVAHATGLAAIARLRADLKDAAEEPNLTTSVADVGIVRTDAAPLATASAGLASAAAARPGGPIGAAAPGGGGRAGGRAAGGRANNARAAGPQRGGTGKGAVAASKAAAAEARARGVNHLFSLKAAECNDVFWAHSSGVCVMADTGSSGSGTLTFFDVDARFTLGSAEHHGVVSVSFSPSDAVVATSKWRRFGECSPKDMLDNSVRLFDARGVRVSEPAWENREAVFAFDWRPRPMLLSGSELKTVRKSLSSISARFADMDKARARKLRLRGLVTRLERINNFEGQLAMMRAATEHVNRMREEAGLPTLPSGDMPDSSGMVEVVVHEETVLSSVTEEAGSVSLTSADSSAISAALAALPEAILPTAAHQEWLVAAGFAMEECAIDPSAAMPQESRGVAVKASESLRRAALSNPPEARAVAYEKQVRELLATPAGSIVARRLAAMLPKPADPSADAAAPAAPAGTLALSAAQRDSLYAAVLLDSVCGHIQAERRKYLTATGSDSPQLAAIFGRVRIDIAALSTACTAVGASHMQAGLAARLDAIRARLRVSSSGVSRNVSEVAAAAAEVLSAVPTLLDLADVLAADTSALNSHPFPSGHPDFSELHRATKDRIRAASRS